MIKSIITFVKELNIRFIDSEDKVINDDMWINGNINVLLISGFPGSGKSTTAKELSFNYDAKIITKAMADYAFNKSHTEEQRGVLYNHINKKWYIDYINDNVQTYGKVILDGWDIEYFDVDFISSCALLVKGTSMHTSRNRYNEKNQTRAKLYHRAYSFDKVKYMNDALNFRHNVDCLLGKITG